MKTNQKKYTLRTLVITTSLCLVNSSVFADGLLSGAESDASSVGTSIESGTKKTIDSTENFFTPSDNSNSPFAGAYVGGKVGSNTSTMTQYGSATGVTGGVEGGYNWVDGHYLFGLDLFDDFTSRTGHKGDPGISENYGTNALGLDGKFGMPYGDWLPYVKLGVAHLLGQGINVPQPGPGSDYRGTRLHEGLGVEYMFAPQLSMAVEWTHDSINKAGFNLINNNYTIGVNYYFSKPAAAPVATKPAPMPVPVAVAPAPTPTPEPTNKTIFSEHPVTCDGGNFATNSARLTMKDDHLLDDVVAFANKNPQSTLVVTGYCDSRGSAALNKRLSLRRAESVKAFLIRKGVPENRITVAGKGFDNPIASNATAAGRAQNRRVEITSVTQETHQVPVPAGN
jgi:OOP family OmpA-OmpF porin